MPRPNPPKKRPRKRPAAGSVRADAALTKQTAQSTQPKTAPPKSGASRGAPQRARGGAVAAVIDPDQMWSKRSYAILVGVFGALVLALNLLQWTLSTSSTGEHAPLLISLIYWSGNPLTLIAAAILAALLAKRLTGEQRTLRLMESLSLGVVAYFICTFVSIAVLFVFGVTGSSATTKGTGPTPCATGPGCSTSSSAGASPSASAGASASARASASASPSANGSGAAVVIPGDVYAGFFVADVVTLIGSYYIYPPLYRRLRMRRPQPGARPDAKRADKRDRATPADDAAKPDKKRRSRDAETAAANETPAAEAEAPGDGAPGEPTA